MITRASVLTILLLSTSAAFAGVKTGDSAPDFDQSMLSSSGRLKLSTLRGKVVLVDFWASWCEPCKKELPILAKIAPRLHARGIELVTVNIDDDTAKAQQFLKQVSIAGLNVVRDTDKRIVGAYEPPKMPSSFAIDKSGVIRAINAGFEDGDEAKIEKQLVALAGK